MGTGRLEAFSDGVIAIIITIMVLDFKVPHSAEWSAITPIIPVFLSYVLSFIFVGIYWNNHHHMLTATKEISGVILWANLHLLFWLSLIPFTTAWLGENHFSPPPVALYGMVLFMAAFAYYILMRLLVTHSQKNSPITRALAKDNKGMVSLICYAVAIAFSFFCTWVSLALYVFVATMWLVPDKRIEKTLEHEKVEG